MFFTSHLTSIDSMCRLLRSSFVKCSTDNPATQQFKTSAAILLEVKHPKLMTHQPRMLLHYTGTHTKGKLKKAYSSLCYKHPATGACMPYGITQLPATRQRQHSRPYPGRYSIYPPIKDKRLSRPELTQANDLPRVAKRSGLPRSSTQQISPSPWLCRLHTHQCTPPN